MVATLPVRESAVRRDVVPFDLAGNGIVFIASFSLNLNHHFVRQADDALPGGMNGLMIDAYLVVTACVGNGNPPVVNSNRVGFLPLLHRNGAVLGNGIAAVYLAVCFYDDPASGRIELRNP